MISARRPAVLAVCLAMLATLMVVVAAPPAAHAASPRPWPAVWDVSPATGEVVPAGGVRIAGTATAPSGIASFEVKVDGQVVPHRIADQNSTAARVHADATLDAGEHLLSIRFTSNDGTPTERTWRVSASGTSVARLDGPDRYATAARIAANGREKQSAPVAVLARGDDHADALAGVPLAHHLGGPLLLTEGTRLSEVTAGALRDLVAPGGTVHLLGGPAAITTDVARAVEAMGFKARRHAGQNRHETAAVVARQLPDFDAAIIASGTSFPDALAAAAPAALQGRPILLTDQGQLPAATREVVKGLKKATIVGGEVVVGRDVAAQLDEVVAKVDRIAGKDRYETAVRVATSFSLDTSTIGLASGTTFPDALVGALDAARRGTGLVLTDGHRLSPATRSALPDLGPGRIVAYGGTAAVESGVLNEARAAVTDRGPAVVQEVPGATETISSLDQITLKLSSNIDMAATSISVHFDGRELPTKASTGDFDDTLVLTVGALTIDPAHNVSYPIRVIGTVRDADGGWTHVDRTWTYRKTSMSSGDSGNQVRDLQNRLTELGYWLGTPDGNYGSLTIQAVMAFQKYERLPITGTADNATLARMETASRPVPADGGGYHVEIDKSRQIMMFAENGRTTWTFNVSTGSEIPYNEEGGSGTAITPTGNFDVCYERDYLRESSLGTLWRPKYFHCGRGIAVHGATSVPGYPASHGCVRVTYAGMNFIWSQNMMPMGARVYVYGSIPR